MNTQLTKTLKILKDSNNKQFIEIIKSSHMNLSAQRIDGENNFKHINKTSDEHIIILEGSLNIWTETGHLSGEAGDIITIPRLQEHGNITAHHAKILVLENKTN